MSAFSQILADAAQLSDEAKVFVGDFVYAPFGIETSETVNAFTLYALLFGVGYIIYRLSLPERGERRRTRVRVRTQARTRIYR